MSRGGSRTLEMADPARRYGGLPDVGRFVSKDAANAESPICLQGSAVGRLERVSRSRSVARDSSPTRSPVSLPSASRNSVAGSPLLLSAREAWLWPSRSTLRRPGAWSRR